MTAGNNPEFPSAEQLRSKTEKWDVPVPSHGEAKW